MIRPTKVFFRSLYPALLLLMFSCEAWDEHYNGALDELPEYNVLEYLKSNPNLSSFAQMVEISGYDTLLSSSQSLTVWSPGNQALAGVDMNNVEEVTEIVENHIARGSFTTTALDSRLVKLVNGKNVFFESTDASVSYGNILLSEENHLASNGQVHVLEDYLPYLFNIQEFIYRTPGFDSLRIYMEGLDNWFFDPELSIELGMDSNNRVVYDSVFVFSNLLLEELGSLGTEDSLYTVILPDNTAWTEVYNRAAPYFKVPEIYGGAKRQQSLARFACVQDMVFRDLVEVPSDFNSLESTIGNVFTDPASLFEGTSLQQVSNGYAYSTSQMPFLDTDSWFKPIIVEAENYLGRTQSNCTPITRSGIGTGLNISNDFYVLLDPIGPTSQSSVTFAIPNTLSGKYNLYCWYVPASVSNPNDLRPTKATYTLNAMNASGTIRRNIFNPTVNVTNPFGMTRLFIGQFEFSFSNIVDEDHPDIFTRLTVLNAVTQEEELSGFYTRQMRIDCIELEPVLE